MVGSLSDELLGFFCRGHVCRDCEHFTACLVADLLRGALKHIYAPGADRYLGALSGKAPGDRTAQTLARATNRRDFAAKAQFYSHLILFRSLAHSCDSHCTVLSSSQVIPSRRLHTGILPRNI